MIRNNNEEGLNREIGVQLIMPSILHSANFCYGSVKSPVTYRLISKIIRDKTK